MMPTARIDTPARATGAEAERHESPPGPRGTTSRNLVRTCASYAWGMLAHPKSTIEALAAERSVRLAVALAAFSVFQTWANNLLFAIFGFDYLGSRPLLTDPTYVGGMGYLRISPEQFRLMFPAFIMLTGVYGLMVPAATAQLLSKLWRGRGTFEQMVNVLVFATAPSILVAFASEWLTGVPLNVLTGSAYFYTDAMQGKFGPSVATLWTIYASAVYIIPWAWSYVLGVIGIHRVQRVPLWSAMFIYAVGFGLNLLLVSTFIR